MLPWQRFSLRDLLHGEKTLSFFHVYRSTFMNFFELFILSSSFNLLSLIFKALVLKEDPKIFQFNLNQTVIPIHFSFSVWITQYCADTDFFHTDILIEY